MKKILSLFLVFVLCFGLAACGKGEVLTDSSTETGYNLSTDSSAETSDEVSTDTVTDKSSQPTSEDDGDLILISKDAVRFAGRLSEKYKVEVVGYGNPVPLWPPILDDYPEKKDQGKPSNVSPDDPGLAEFDEEEVKYAICTWIELALYFGGKDGGPDEDVDDLKIRPEDWTQMKFWKNDAGEIVLFVELRPNFTYRGDDHWSGIYAFRVTRRKA